MPADVPEGVDAFAGRLLPLVHRNVPALSQLHTLGKTRAPVVQAGMGTRIWG